MEIEVFHEEHTAAWVGGNQILVDFVLLRSLKSWKYTAKRDKSRAQHTEKL